MNLYFITTDHDVTDGDLHVVAEDRDDAVASWLRYYDLEPEEAKRIQRIFLINTNASAGPISWHGPDCKEIL